MARIRLAQIAFFNGVPSTIRGIGPCISSKQADLFYDTELGLIEYRRLMPPDPHVQRFSNVGVSMVFEEKPAEAAKPAPARRTGT